METAAETISSALRQVWRFSVRKHHLEHLPLSVGGRSSGSSRLSERPGNKGRNFEVKLTPRIESAWMPQRGFAAYVGGIARVTEREEDKGTVSRKCFSQSLRSSLASVD